MSVSLQLDNLNTPLVAPLLFFTRGSIALAAGKAANLGELIRAGFQIPTGFVITTAAYHLLTQARGLETVSTCPQKRLRKVIFTVVGFLATFVALITVVSFIFAEIQ